MELAGSLPADLLDILKTETNDILDLEGLASFLDLDDAAAFGLGMFFCCSVTAKPDIKWLQYTSWL